MIKFGKSSNKYLPTILRTPLISSLGQGQGPQRPHHRLGKSSTVYVGDMRLMGCTGMVGSCGLRASARNPLHISISRMERSIIGRTIDYFRSEDCLDFVRDDMLGVVATVAVVIIIIVPVPH
jgi:aminopeptidase-like protein